MNNPIYEFVPVVSLFIKNKLPKSESEKIVSGISKKFTGLSFSQAVQKFLDICLGIDAVKRAAIGFKSSTGQSNLLCNMIAEDLAWSFYEKAIDADVDYLNKLAIQYQTNERFHWLWVKTMVLQNKLAQLVRLEQFLDSFSLKSTSAVPVGKDYAILDIISGVSELRRYGIKNSFFSNPLVSPAKTLIVWDPLEFVIPLDYSNRQNTVPTISGEDLIVGAFVPRNSVLEKPEFRERPSSVGSLGYHTFVSGIDKLLWKLRTDGELYIIDNRKPLRAAFVSRGLEVEYDEIRYLAASLMFDLTVSRDTVKRVPRLTLSPLDRLMWRVKNFPPIRDLIVPRVRILQDNFQFILGAVEKEVEDGEEETRQRRQREHPVVAHIRILPEGYHPSEEAKSLAAQYGIKLRDNETFIRQHTRGQGHPVEAYRIVKNEF